MALDLRQLYQRTRVKLQVKLAKHFSHRDLMAANHTETTFAVKFAEPASETIVFLVMVMRATRDDPRTLDQLREDFPHTFVGYGALRVDMDGTVSMPLMGTAYWTDAQSVNAVLKRASREFVKELAEGTSAFMGQLGFYRYHAGKDRGTP